MDFSKYIHPEPFPQENSEERNLYNHLESVVDNYVDDPSLQFSVRVLCDKLRSRMSDNAEKFVRALEAWSTKEADLVASFKHDALTELGILDHPMAEKAFNLAWEGTGNDCPSTFEWLERIAQLLKEAP